MRPLHYLICWPPSQPASPRTSGVACFVALAACTSSNGHRLRVTYRLGRLPLAPRKHAMSHPPTHDRSYAIMSITRKPLCLPVCLPVCRPVARSKNTTIALTCGAVYGCSSPTGGEAASNCARAFSVARHHCPSARGRSDPSTTTNPYLSPSTQQTQTQTHIHRA